jgi:hypothetical protein
MKKLLAFFILAGLIPACIFAEITAPAGGDTSGLATTTDLANYVPTSSVTQTVTSDTDTVPSNAAVEDALAGIDGGSEISITNGVVSGYTTFAGCRSSLIESGSGDARNRGSADQIELNSGTSAGYSAIETSWPFYSFMCGGQENTSTNSFLFLTSFAVYGGDPFGAGNEVRFSLTDDTSSGSTAHLVRNGVGVYVTNNTAYAFYCDDDSTETIFGSGLDVTGATSFVVAMENDNGTLTAYWDGVEIGSTNLPAFSFQASAMFDIYAADTAINPNGTIYMTDMYYEKR